MMDYKAYQYILRSISVLNDGKDVLFEIEKFINEQCKAGYRLHSIDFSQTAAKVIYVTFERLETIRGFTDAN